ncbi:MAG: hypothetical protein EXR77_00780 [Myxococcales bacterium]|nr:hypothetical protein [Myxococcales bacterium]
MSAPDAIVAANCFAVLRGAVANVRTWLDRHQPAGVIAVRGVTLAHWGAHCGAHECADGRSVGCFDGVLLNADVIRAGLVERGHSAHHWTHAALAIETVAAHGPNGVGLLRWHGALAVLHRAQAAVLVARDLVGVGWLGWTELDDGAELVCSDPRRDGPTVTAVPPGAIAVVDASVTTQPKFTILPHNQAFLRQIPDQIRSMDAQQAASHVAELLQHSLVAHGQAFGDIDTSAVADHRWLTQYAGEWLSAARSPAPPPAVWTPVGLHDTTGAQDAKICKRQPNLRDDGPWEPLVGTCPSDRRERLWRHQIMPDGVLRQARVQALQTGAALCAPHLDPALLALLGALEPSIRPPLLGVPAPAVDS